MSVWIYYTQNYFMIARNTESIFVLHNSWNLFAFFPMILSRNSRTGILVILIRSDLHYALSIRRPINKDAEQVSIPNSKWCVANSSLYLFLFHCLATRQVWHYVAGIRNLLDKKVAQIIGSFVVVSELNSFLNSVVSGSRNLVSNSVSYLWFLNLLPIHFMFQICK